MAEREQDRKQAAADAQADPAAAAATDALSASRPQTEVAALEAEIVRLNKVVDALMDWSEASTNVQGSEFGLFQTTVMLQDQVRLQTEALQAALRDRERDARVSSMSASHDMQTLRRTASLQIQLLELVVQQKDVGELVERVASILDIPIVLFDMHGGVVAASRSVARWPDLAGRLWGTYLALEEPAGQAGIVTEAGHRVFYREVLVMGRAERVLAVQSAPHRPSDFTGASLLFLEQLVTLELLRNRDELRMRRRVRRGLLRDVLTSQGSAEDLRIRLQEQGFTSAGVHRVAVVEPESARPAPGPTASGTAGHWHSAAVLRALEAWLSERRVPFLTLARGPAVVVLTSLRDAEPATAHHLLADLLQATATATTAPLVVGCSAALEEFSSVPRCFQQARAACMAARRSPAGGRTAVFDELSGHLILLDGLDEKALTDIVRRTFAPLLDHDAAHRTNLYKTLFTLFENQLAVQQTADQLYIHRNTLQKRLAHVEELLGIDVNELDDIVDIQLGLQAAMLLGQQPD